MIQRPVKFRAQWIDTKKWCYSDEKGFSQSSFWESIELGRLDRNTLGQSIGLYDKREKYVFEGDYLSDTDDEEPSLFRIMWHDETAGFVIEAWNGGEEFEESGTSIWEIVTDKRLDLEVIGNIYENPEL